MHTKFVETRLLVALLAGTSIYFSPTDWLYAQSEIVMDGSTGVGNGAIQDFSGVAGTKQTIILDGGGANRHGTVNGANLFFSFAKFGVSSGDTAQFQCTGCAALNNVISRVTGSSASIINGNIKSLVPNADFWFFNPNGVILGAGSAIDVPAALHISSGNVLNFGADSLSSKIDPARSSFSVANPSSFGFDDSPGANISVSGTTITVGNSGAEIAAAADVSIDGHNDISSAGAVHISAGNAVGSDSKITLAENSVTTMAGGGSLALSAPGDIIVDAHALLDGNVSAGQNLSNSGTITGHGQAGIDVVNTDTGEIADGANANNNIENSGLISGASVLAGQDIKNTGTISLIKNSDVSVSAGRDLIINGNGIISINHAKGAETISAGRDLVLGQNASTGGIEKSAGRNDLVVRSGNGALLINNVGSGITDNSVGAGDMTVTVPTGNLLLGNGARIAKLGAGHGKLMVDVKKGNIDIDADAQIVAGQNNSDDLIKAGGAITNSGQLTVDTVQADGNLLNNIGADITGNVESEQVITNAGVITGKAIAGTDLINKASGLIGDGVAAGNDVLNSGVINGATVQAGRDISNIGSSAQINLNKLAAYNRISSGGNLLVEQGGRITATNPGNTYILAGNHITVKDAGSKITVNNQGLKTVVAAGSVLAAEDSFTADGNLNEVLASKTGGSLRVNNGAIIEKTLGAGTFSIIAQKQAGASLLEKSNAGQISIAGPGAKISADHQGTLVINAEATAGKKAVDKNGKFLVADKSQFALQVDKGGVINTGNNAELDVQAQTVFLHGDAVKGGNADMTFSSRSNLTEEEAVLEQSSSKRPAQHFKMEGATIADNGSVTIKNYYLDMVATSVPSGINAGQEINLQVQNVSQFAFPEVLVGRDAKEQGERLLKNYLNTEILNKQRISTPDANKAIKSAALAVLARPIGMPVLPKNPCDRERGQSTLNAPGTGSYLPAANVQLPYSIVAAADNELAVAGIVDKTAAPVTSPIPGREADECR